MKYQTAIFADGVFTINCPHCTSEVQVDEVQLGQINGQMAGRYNCPIPACAKEIEFPTAEEAAALKAGGMAPAPAPVPVPAPAGPTPAPPPQGNPAAKPTQPPVGAPAPAAPAPAAAIPPSPPATSAPSAEGALSKGTQADIVVGFHGSKGDTLEREAAMVQRMIVKTILHGDCVKDGKDDFDEMVSKFLSELDEDSLVSVHPVQSPDEKKGTDFGVLIIYKISTEAD
jgi:hypothetical protein